MNQITKTMPFSHPAENGFKVCTGCLEKLPLSNFGKRNKRGKIGIQSKCRTCRSFIQLQLHFKKKYGIIWNDYERMYEAQQGLCYLCDEGGDLRLPNGRPRLLIDHHHESSQVRKLLCNTCNWKIGILETTSKTWMKRAKEYISDV